MKRKLALVRWALLVLYVVIFFILPRGTTSNLYVAIPYALVAIGYLVFDFILKRKEFQGDPDPHRKPKHLFILFPLLTSIILALVLAKHYVHPFYLYGAYLAIMVMFGYYWDSIGKGEGHHQ